MPKSAGLLIFFDEQQRRDLLRSRIDSNYRPFSDALSVPDIPIRSRSLALLSFSGETIDFIAIAQKGNRVATSKSRIEFVDVVDLAEIPIRELEAQLPSTVRHHMVRSSRGTGGGIPEGTWASILDAVKVLRPAAAREVDRLSSLVSLADTVLTGGAAGVLLQQRDAIGISLDIFSGSNVLRDEVLGSWAPPRREVSEAAQRPGEATLGMLAGASSFQQGLPSRFFQEESALQHDLFNFDGAPPSHQAGSSTFVQGSRRLEIVYANRNALERTLGVDLIYYNENYEMYVLVQYKLMKADDGEFMYRPDKQMRREIERMDRFISKYPPSDELVSHDAFRLNTDGFMFKLVPDRGLSPASGELIQGMYLTRPYTKFLLGPNGPRGKNGGCTITFDGAPRRLSNTDFTNAVRQGWIGTSGVQTAGLKEIIQEYRNDPRALIIAYETGAVKAQRRGRVRSR